MRRQDPNTADNAQKELTHRILLHPSYFGPRMTKFLESKLYADVEGTCSGRFGYIIAVLGIVDIGKGMVMSGTGQAEFVTKYRAIVFKPFKGEVVDGVVTNVNKVNGIILPQLLLTFADGLFRRGGPAAGFRVEPCEWAAMFARLTPCSSSTPT